MKFREIGRAILHKAEPVIYLPIRLDYTDETVDEGTCVLPDRGGRHFELDMRRLLEEAYGYSGIFHGSAVPATLFGVTVEDRPATIINVVEARKTLGIYGGGQGMAVHIHLRIKILRSGNGALVAKKIFYVSPPHEIRVYPGQRQYGGVVTGDFPYQQIMNWLKSFPSRKAD